MMLVFAGIDPLLAGDANGTVKGRVSNEKGEPLAAASVTLQEGRGTSANAAGEFIISGVPPGTYRLQVTAVGYQSMAREVTVRDNQVLEINFSLKETNASLNEVIVTGYLRQSKRDITGAVSTISADVVAKTPVTDVGSVLQGRVAGVSVDAQGGPGNSQALTW